MDVTSNEKTNLVVHRVRKQSSSQSLPIQGSRGLLTDGIGSPSDPAYAPPGVVTKFDYINTKKVIVLSTPKQMICSNCHKKVNCYCKKCTLEKLQIYSKRGNLSLKSEEKKKLQKEVNQIIEEDAKLRSQISTTHGNVLQLQKKVENAKMRLAKKREECERLDEIRPSVATPAQFQVVFAKHEEHFEKSKQWKIREQIKLKEAEKKLAKNRTDYCLAACFLFPVKEFDVNVESVASTTRNPRNWAVVNDRIEEGRQFTIRGASTNEQLRKRLTSSLSKGTISLPSELHQPFAAFTNTIQLVHLLNLIFNFRPPLQTCHRNVCIRMNWSKDIMSNDWNTLCASVIYLCTYVGMNPSTLIYKNPHYNLIEFTSFVCANDNILKIGGRPNSDISDVKRIILGQEPDASSRTEDDDDTWCFVE